MTGACILALLAAAGCATSEFGAPPGDGSRGDLVEVHGVVVDSVTRERLPRLNVSVAGSFTTTDGQGEFVLPAPIGTDTFHVASAGYEHFALPLDVLPASGVGPTLQLQLRRLGPVATRCAMNTDGFHAVVVDLQGRKSLERWSMSTLGLIEGTQYRTIPAVNWTYRALDYTQWEVTIPDASPSTNRADWVLFDSDGFVWRGSCEPVPVIPDSP